MASGTIAVTFLKEIIATQDPHEFLIWKEYSKNEIVNKDGKLYISLVDNNVGNYPQTSPKWFELL